jgi:hypothetical protein
MASKVRRNVVGPTSFFVFVCILIISCSRFFDTKPVKFQFPEHASKFIFCDDPNLKHFHWRVNWRWHACTSDTTSFTPRFVGERLFPGSHVVPIFVLFNEKSSALSELIRSCHETLKTSFRIIVIDFGSKQIAAKDLLLMLETNGVEVYRLANIAGAHELARASPIISSYMKNHSNYTHYAVTDSDISLHGVAGDVLEVFKAIMHKVNNNTGVVGPALDIDHLPNDSYYDKARDSEHTAIGWETRFWPPQLQSIHYCRRRVYYMSAPIDTTFGLFARTTAWGRLLKPSVRVSHPFAMKHIDFEYSMSLGIPDDMVRYSCEKAKNDMTHFIIDNCSAVKIK